MSNLLRINGLTKNFGSRRVLDDASFSIRSGEVLGLVGPNGAGKTTLLECLAGLLPYDSGAVESAGGSVSANRKETLFYLPDAIFPWAEQTVKSIIGFFKELYSSSNQVVAELSKPLRLAELLNARVGSLSKGERKRLLLALGLLTPQPLLLLDEPFDGLDLRQSRDVIALLRAHASAGRTLMLSIHQLIDAGRVCDRLVLLTSGRVVGEGTLAELQTKTNLPDAGVEEIFLALT
ncbi:MAG TPA: ABC transporter ATP-binding protein [Pyrinomonadaceae bacterium]|nr:ABC transporter ATP-binding protein [Pyrinomonadaceae bacterium]